MGHRVRMKREELEQHRRAGSREAGDIDRPVDGDGVEAVGDETGLKVAEARPQARVALEEAAEPIGPGVDVYAGDVF
ncbi:hypothetical protein [Chelatococcus sp. GW1]|uniref:hypothetical protein n=1 Tax=Chelatococcus sp. GW1 TaxID=1211115 RepID=UPI001FDA0BEA|nr:hypothetical protein [Chelatococcus sp. GW1]